MEKKHQKVMTGLLRVGTVTAMTNSTDTVRCAHDNIAIASHCLHVSHQIDITMRNPENVNYCHRTSKDQQTFFKVVKKSPLERDAQMYDHFKFIFAYFWHSNIPTWNLLLCAIFGESQTVLEVYTMECLRLATRSSCQKYANTKKSGHSLGRHAAKEIERNLFICLPWYQRVVCSKQSSHHQHCTGDSN
jgi:hypothetical protein